MYSNETYNSSNGELVKEMITDMAFFFKENKLLRLPSVIEEVPAQKIIEADGRADHMITYVDTKVDYCYAYMLNCNNILLLPESYSFELFAICALGVGGLYNRGSLIKDFRALTHFTTNMHGLIMLNQFMNKIYRSYGNNEDKYYNIVNSIMRFNDAATRYNGYDILGKNLAEITGLSHRATNSNDTLSYLARRMFPGPDSVYSISENRINLFTGTTLLCDKIYKVIL